jgi:hypothetical protein
MDGYEYERKVLWPKWNAEVKSNNANSSINDDVKDRLKKDLGIEIPKDQIDVQMNLGRRIFGEPSNFYPELSPDYELMKSTRKHKWG